MQVGDILYTSWGYEQTNVEFYQVTKMIGKKMVEVREIAKKYVENETMSGTSTPIRDKFIGKPLRRRISVWESREQINIGESRGSAWLWDGKPVSESHYA